MDLHRTTAEQVPYLERGHDAGIPRLPHGGIACPSSWSWSGSWKQSIGDLRQCNSAQCIQVRQNERDLVSSKQRGFLPETIGGLYRPRVFQCFLRISMLYVKRVYHIRILTLHTANNSLGSPSHQKTSGYEWEYATTYVNKTIYIYNTNSAFQGDRSGPRRLWCRRGPKWRMASACPLPMPSFLRCVHRLEQQSWPSTAPRSAATVCSVNRGHEATWCIVWARFFVYVIYIYIYVFNVYLYLHLYKFYS